MHSTKPIRFTSAAHCERDSAVSQSSPAQVASLARSSGLGSQIGAAASGLHSAHARPRQSVRRKTNPQRRRLAPWHLRAPSVPLRLHPAAINSITISFAILKLQSSAAALPGHGGEYPTYFSTHFEHSQLPRRALKSLGGMRSQCNNH